MSGAEHPFPWSEDAICRPSAENGAPWTPVAAGYPLPPTGQVVQVRTPGGDERPLKFDRLWWLPDGSMYVYFTPTHWRLLPPAVTEGPS